MAYEFYAKRREEIERVDKILKGKERSTAFVKSYDAVIAKYKEYLKLIGGKENYELTLQMKGYTKEALDNIYDNFDAQINYIEKKRADIKKKEEEEKKKREEEAKKNAKKGVGPTGILPVEPKKAIDELSEMADQYTRLMYDLVNDIDKYWDFVATSTSAAEEKMWLDKIDEAQKGIKKYEAIIGTVIGSGGFEAIDGADMKSVPNRNNKPDKTVGNDNSLASALNISDEELDEIEKQMTAGLQLALEFNEAIGDLLEAQFDRKLEMLDEEEIRLGEYYDNKIRLAEGDADLQKKLAIQREEAEKKIEKKRKKLEYEKAKQKKKTAMIDAAINTAIGITAALTLQPAGYVLAAITAALGAIQVAAIAAQPLPAYAKGTENHKGGHAILGDGGKNELAISPTGGLYVSGNTPEVVDMERGTKVIPDAQAYIQREVVKSVLAMEKQNNDLLVDKITDAVIDGFSGVKINNRNNNNVTVSIDHAMWRNNLLN